MTHVVINENTTEGKHIIEYLKNLKSVKFLDPESIPNKTTLKAMEEVEKGKLRKFKSVKDLMKDLKS